MKIYNEDDDQRTAESSDNEISEMASRHRLEEFADRFGPDVLNRLQVLRNWEMGLKSDTFRFQKHYRFKSLEAAEEYARTMGAFLKTNTVFVLVHKPLEKDFATVVIRAGICSNALTVAAEIARECDRKHAILVDHQENAA